MTQTEANEDQSGRAIRPNLFGFVLVFALGLSFCWLLYLAYPEGLLNEEALTYWLLNKHFHWFAPNQLDWYRTIPYGMLLGLAAQAPNPTSWLYWLNSSIFSLNYSLVFVLGLSFFSRRGALYLAILSLLFEVVSMRLFYNNLGISPDALMGDAIFLGTLLCLIGWLRRITPLLLSGCAVFGLVSFMKPMGVALWPVWIPLILIFAIRNFSKLNQRVAITLACIGLLVLPLSLWSIRNYCLYGYALSSGVGGNSLLQIAIPIMTGNEHLFDSAKTQMDFRLATQACESYCRKYVAQPDEKDNANLAKQFRYERYFITGPATNNPFQVLLAEASPGWHGVGYHWLLEFTPEQMFKMNAEAGRVAWRIIAAHPISYIEVVLREYATMFCPLDVWTNPLYSFQENPHVAYAYWDHAREGPRQKYPQLFMGNDFASGAASNQFAAQILSAISKNPLSTFLLDSYYVSEFFLSHAIFIGAVILLWQLFRKPQHFVNHTALKKFAFAEVVLFLTAASCYLLIATCQVARLRYLLVGESELHLLGILFLMGTAQFLRKLSSNGLK